MKFGKKLRAQMVQEWQGAYLDYNRLKKLLKGVKKPSSGPDRARISFSLFSGLLGRTRSITHSRKKNGDEGTSEGPISRESSDRARISFGMFSGPLARTSSITHSPEKNGNVDEGALEGPISRESSGRARISFGMFSGPSGRSSSITHSTEKNGNGDEGTFEGPISRESSHGSCFQTTFFRPTEEGGEMEGKFFECIDQEFNKVVDFYMDKVVEVMLRAEELSKQMDLLDALRMRVESQNQGRVAREEEEIEQTSDASTRGDEHVIAVEEEDDNSPHRDASEEEEKIEQMSNASTRRDEHIRDSKPLPIQILDQIKINVRSSKSDPSFSTEELKKSKKKLQRAMVEFYHQLQLLKSYRLMNLLAFSKIMKKYDKITSRNTSNSYLEIVDKSYIGSCDQVNSLIERVETAFITHFTDGNRRDGMKQLRPRQKKESHAITFFLGLFSGCSIALLAAIIICVQARDHIHHDGREQYMPNIYPLYSLFVYIVLHMLLFGAKANTYFWRRYRVNYSFIFGFKQGTEMGFREIFLLASGLTVLTLAFLLANLDMEMDPDTHCFRRLTELVPLGLVMVLLLITFCPFNIVYRSSRFFLIRCMWRCILAPFYVATFSDFFLAEQLTSQVQAIRSLQFYVCYYGSGDFQRRSNKCLDSDIYENVYIAVAVFPFMARVLQCLRRKFEEKSPRQGLNALKYFSTVVALVMRTMYCLRKQTSWRIMAMSTSGIATIYNTYWDIVIDWGILRKNAKNKWLRDNLLISSKAVYFVAIVVNILLRLVWMHLILDFNEAPFLHRNSMVVIVACLEILRRGIWNFLRLENEHFNNVGQFRAFKSVNLPFYHEDEKTM